MAKFKLFDTVYIKPTNAVGMIIWVPDDVDIRDDYRTDMDGMQCGADLEPLELHHLAIKDIRIASRSVKYVYRYHEGLPQTGFEDWA
jgi:hypothetical protein